ncbi:MULTISPECIES: hypothetical protein [unclassified Ruminococcus]|uniref:hypothetical protein n=1 Tax=unclassified Ruminococcus TaxID=2608920 RepID=UPI0021096C2D|nr:MULTISPECIES: hypothetical protein [unclassified Ruminococcus]MCQ4022545.1 hypothetical protein [Ruminococcus sp. zg-924]MCQ4114785.1 hypothetical protein [Ruminococcus sp. zg-921]
MALQIDYPITVDLKKPNCIPSFAVQGDTAGRRLVVTLTSDGSEADISDCSAQLKCSYNNETVDIGECEILDNRVIAPLTSAMLAHTGNHKLQLTLFDNTGAVVSSPIIYIYVSESIGDGTAANTPEFSALNALTSRIEATLNNPEVGESEVKDSRGGYKLLGDRINAIEKSALTAQRFLNAKNCVKQSVGFTADNIGSEHFQTNGLTLTAEDGCVVAQGTTGNPGSVYAMFDKPIQIMRGSSKQILVSMRLKAVESDLKVFPIGGRYLDYYNYLCDSNIIHSNITEYVGANSSCQTISTGEWVTLWTLLGDTGQTFKLGGDKTEFNGLGVYIPAPSDGSAPKLMIQSVCAYVSDSEERDLLSEIKADITSNSFRITVAEGKLENHTAAIDNLQTEVNKMSQTLLTHSTEIKKNSDNVAEVKSAVENIQRDIASITSDVLADKQAFEAVKSTVNDNSERLTVAENDISDVQESVMRISEDIETHTNTDTAFNTRITDLENKAATALKEISDIKANIGLGDEVVGLQVDFENRKFMRLAGAIDLSAGTDFDKFKMYGGRRRCNVDDDGIITAYYGDENYAEDGSNGQVMVYQPAFYYKVVPVIYEKNKSTGIGYHMRKANYYVTSRPHDGFKLHPAFFDADGNEVDYILYSAYEGSMYEASTNKYITDDSDTSTDIDLSSDLICSISGIKPISGLYKNLTRANFETLSANRGTGWHCDTIKSVSANQLLMMIELGTMNMQSAIGPGVVNITDDTAYNCSSITGATSLLGNTTGQAIQTMNTINGSGSIYTESGKVSVSYRGIENPWGNIWKCVNGINIWGDGNMDGGQPFIADDLNFAESTHSDNYKAAGFTIPSESGYINAMGYGKEEYDWLLMPSETGGNSSLPVGDYCYATENLNGYNIARIGGGWYYDRIAGACSWACHYGGGTRGRNFGGRLTFIPTAAT